MDHRLPPVGTVGAAGMSEYQYYEFLALNRPLTDKQHAELRSLFTRAEITATRFVNEYHWGDLKGDPQKMVERYFDAFLYLANWGTRRLIFRLPRGVLDEQTAGLYCYTDAASVAWTAGHLIVSLYADRDPDDYWEEPGGQLAAMIQARSELAAGDLRLLYLGWLLAVQSDDVDDKDADRRCRPPGGAERAAAGDRRLRPDRSGSHRRGRAGSPAIQPSTGLTGRIASLPAVEKDTLLARVAAGEGAQVQALLLRRLRAAFVARLPLPGRPRSYGRRQATAKPGGRKPKSSASAGKRPARPLPGLPATPGTSTTSPPGLRQPGRRPRRSSRRSDRATTTWR